MYISDPIKETLVQNMDQLSSRVDELFIYLENELPSTSERQWKTIDKNSVRFLLNLRNYKIT